MSKQVHYNIDRLNKENANYNLIIGEKSNGKSYQVKHKEGIEHFLNDKMKFWLLRRWKADITTIWLEKYFSDVNIEKYTNKSTGGNTFIGFIAYNRSNIYANTNGYMCYL